MSPLNKECTALLAKGLHPKSVIAVAQQLDISDVIQRAFPTMPNHIVFDLMNGTRQVEFVSEGQTSAGESFTWRLISPL